MPVFRKGRVRALPVALVFATLLLAACGGAAPQSAPAKTSAGGGSTQAASTGTQTQSPAQLESLQVGLAFNNLEVVPVWAALQQKFWQKYGLDVSIVNIQGGSATIAAMASGKLPLAFAAGASVLPAVVKGVQITQIAGLVDVLPYDFLVAPSIHSAAQLKGAKGGISGFGGADYAAQQFALEKLGVDPKSVSWLTAGNETTRLAALKAGRIQFTALTAGLDTDALQAGFKPLLKLYETDQKDQHASLAVYKPWAATHKTEILEFLKGLIAGLQWMKDPANEQAALNLASSHLHIPAATLKSGFELYRDHLFESYPLVSVVGMQFEIKQQTANVPVSATLDNSYVQELQSQGFMTSGSSGTSGSSSTKG
jgi:ABC-type nitrate/sulfonate/bicarbonate transport system substrate-binding protein